MAQSQTFPLPSGATLAVTVASFADSWRLTQAVLKALKGANLSPEALKGGASAFGVIVDRVLEIATSPDVDVAMWKCGEKALYRPAGSDDGFPGEKLTRNIFDNANYGLTARGDFPKIAMALMEVNCQPFLAQALSTLSDLLKTPLAAPASKSEMA